jgi:hypothetical protein
MQLGEVPVDLWIPPREVLEPAPAAGGADLTYEVIRLRRETKKPAVDDVRDWIPFLMPEIPIRPVSTDRHPEQTERDDDEDHRDENRSEDPRRDGGRDEDDSGARPDPKIPRRNGG